MTTIMRRFFEEGKETNAGGAHDDPQPRKREQEASKKEAGQPGSAANVAGMDSKKDGDRPSPGREEAEQ
jgi:hypothetical protein